MLAIWASVRQEDILLRDTVSHFKRIDLAVGARLYISLNSLATRLRSLYMSILRDATYITGDLGNLLRMAIQSVCRNKSDSIKKTKLRGRIAGTTGDGVEHLFGVTEVCYYGVSTYPSRYAAVGFRLWIMIR